MKKILFTPGIASIEALGSITRLIAIADEIKKRQDDVTILFRTAGKEAEYARKCGYEVVAGYKPKFDLKNIMHKQRKNSLSTHKQGINSVCDVMKLKGLISKEYIQRTFEEEMELVENFKPDLIFGEFETVMPIVAKKCGIPYVCTGGTPNEKNFCHYGFSNKNEEGYEANYNELLKSLNLENIENICELNQSYNSSKIFIPSIPELEDLEEKSKCIFLGSVIPKNFIRSNFDFKKKRPLIYVYLSVGQIKADVYEKVIVDTFSDSEFDVIVTAGGTKKEDVDSNSSNIHFMSMVPADKVLSMADIAIHHGGQNTTVQCIENEVPSIIFPGNHFERYFNAEKASEIGCAKRAEISDFNKEYLLETCRSIIKDNNFKQNLNKYSKEIKSYGGAAKVAEYILQVY